MRRKVGVLLPIELSILGSGLDLLRQGVPEFHGYAIARAIREGGAGRRLTAHGTLYRALDRLERDGLLESRWEDPGESAIEHRPRRRFYHVTALGEAAAGAAVSPESQLAAPLRRRMAGS
ncbi:MAG: PadR family transcriptional regulator [Tepidiformaceae bacterium]